MSVVIAAKYKDGVAIASDKQATGTTTKSDNAIKMQYFKYSNSAMGVVGYLRDCNLIRALEEIVPYKDILDRIKIDEMYVIKKIVPTIHTILEANHRVRTDSGIENMTSVMLYATDDNIYMIGPDFSVIEADSYFSAIGCGDDKAIGYLSSIGDTSNLSKAMITRVLKEAVQKGCEKDVYINDLVDIMYLEKNNENSLDFKKKKDL